MDRAGLGGQAPVLRRGPAVAVRGEGDPVLLLARDGVLLGHLLGRLAHRQAGGRLGDGRRVRHEVARPHPRERGQAGAERFRLLRLHQDAGHAPAVEDRHVGEAFRPTGDPDVHVTEQDRGSHVGDRLVRGGAGAVDRVGGHRLRQPGPERDLAAEVRGLDRGDHLPHHQRPDRSGIDLRALEELADADLPEVDGRQVPEHRPGTDERRAASGHDRDSSVAHGTHIPGRGRSRPSRDCRGADAKMLAHRPRDATPFGIGP